jgi:Protein of unknown function (DUF3738)
LFEIEARADGHPTKDQMRLMMQSLLADRFKLAVHFESREMNLFALVVVKPGKLGPKLRPHEQGPSCDPSAEAANGARADVFPPRFQVYARLKTAKGTFRDGSRDTTMAIFAGSLTQLGHPCPRTRASGARSTCWMKNAKNRAARQTASIAGAPGAASGLASTSRRSRESSFAGRLYPPRPGQRIHFGNAQPRRYGLRQAGAGVGECRRFWAIHPPRSHQRRLVS